MDRQQSQQKVCINSFDRMWLDSLLSQTRTDFYLEAWNMEKASDSKEFRGLTFQQSNELFVNLPGVVRGLLYIEDRDYYVAFVDNENGGEIGIIHEDTKEYEKKVDSKIYPELGISQDQWVDCTAKIDKNCRDLYLYFSTNDVYKRINLDDPCEKYEEIELINSVPVAPPEVDIIESAGNLPNGIYSFAAKARDKEGNDSNWSKISNPVSISDGDNKGGELSNEAINVKIRGLDNPDYHIIDLAVISNIKGTITVNQFASVSTHNSSSSLDYLYTGETGREQQLNISDIKTRTNRYIRGKNLTQYDNRLILYNLRPVPNLDYQRRANQIETDYVNYILPTEHAEEFKMLRRNENYWFAIQWNYEDNTSSHPFPIPGREGCQDVCTEYRDNSFREETFIDLDDLGIDKKIKVSDTTDHTPIPETEDERTSVPGEDLQDPTVLEDFEQMDEIGLMDMKESLDCLCEKVDQLESKNGPPGPGTWQLDDDLHGAITLYQLKCMCENREALTDVPGDDDDDDTGGGSGGSGGSGGGSGGEDDYDTGGGGSPLPEPDDDELDSENTAPYSQASLSDFSSEQIDAITEALEDDLKTVDSCVDGECGLCGEACDDTNGCSNSTCSGSIGYVDTENKFEGRFGERHYNYFKKQLEINKKLKDRERLIRNTPHGQKREWRVGGECTREGARNYVGDNCYVCRNGKWCHENNVRKYKANENFSTQVEGEIGLKSGDFSFEKIYDEDGCTVIDVKPKKYSKGKFGSWCTQETYPETINCECEPIYGDLAGERVRLHKVPSISKEPHFISLSKGVPNKYDMSNSEFKDSYVLGIGPSFSNIQFPENPPKPLNKNNPYSIVYVKRTEQNKTVAGSSLGHSCFKGFIGGETYAIPKHGVNSFEFFDRHIEPNSENSTYRGGQHMDDAAPYFIHSPDFHLRRPLLDATTCILEGEIYGHGMRHGCFSEGEEPESPRQDKRNQKGTRQAINMNKIIRYSEPVVRDVKAMSVARADSVVQRGENFTYPLSNQMRESGVYMELEGQLQPFSQGDSERKMSGKYGGNDSVVGDNASDRSFTGDIYTETIPIHDARAHHMTFIRHRPSQYGSPINQSYVPLGLEAKGMDTQIDGLVGDSHIGAFTYKRIGEVSDKTNRIISRLVGIGGFRVENEKVEEVIGNLLEYIFRTLGIKNGGYVPETQDPQDYIRVFGGLRFINSELTSGTVSNPGEVSEDSPVPDPARLHPTTSASSGVDINFGDNYVPQNLKTQVTTFLESDANLNFRQLNEVENGEVYYSENRYTLKGLSIDSSMPEETEWEKGWLNRWYSIWKENARWKIIVQAIILFTFNYLVGFYFIWEGLSYFFEGVSALGGGSMGMRSMGGYLTMIFSVLFVILGFAWIRFWAESDADNKFVEEWMKLKNIRPDRRNPDGSYSFNEKRFRNFEDNFFKYDFVHDTVNEWEVSYGIPDPYDTCDCSTVYTNEIRYSNKQIMDSTIDFWRNFKPNNDLEIPTLHGKLTNMFVLGGELHAHTTDMLMKLTSGRGQNPTPDNILLGTGSLFGGAYPIYGGVIEGYGGLKDPNAAEVSAYGYFFPDRDAHKWYKYTSGMPQPISDLGVSRFMDQNMDFELLNAFPDFKLVDLKLPGGIGYSFGINHNKGVAYFTKIDYKPIREDIVLNNEGTGFNVSLNNEKYFENRSFTLSFDLSSQDGAWISFHSMLPHLYAWNRRDMYSFNLNEMYKHDVEGKFLNFYGEFHQASVEFPVNDTGQNGTYDSFYYRNTAVDAESFKWEEYGYRSLNRFFNKALFYNSHQLSGVKEFVDGEELDYQEMNKDSHDIKLNRKGKIWKFNSVNDYKIDDESMRFNRRTEVGPKEPNEEALSSDIQKEIFYDNYLVNRLIYDIFDNTKVILKRVKTSIDVKNQQ